MRVFLRRLGALGAVALLGGFTPFVGAPAGAEPPWETVTAASGAEDWSAITLHRGAPRIAYRLAGGGLGYAWCDASCGQASSWRQVTVQAGGDVRAPSIAVDAWGRPRIAYRHDLNLRYAACDAACDQPGSWVVIEFERVSDGATRPPSLALDASGRPRIAYTWKNPASSEHRIRYAACDAACADRANWSILFLTYGGVAHDPSLGLDGDRPRIAYSYFDFYHPTELRFASCDDRCTDESRWGHVTIPGTVKNSYSASMVLRDGRPRVIFRGGATDQSLAYASCEDACLSGTSWSTTAIDSRPLASSRPKLALANGRPRAVVSGTDSDGQTHHLYLMSCDGNCTTPAGWGVEEQSLGGNRGVGPVIATDGDRPHIAFAHTGENRIVYAFCGAACGSPGTYPPPPSDPPPPTGGGGSGSGSSGQGSGAGAGGTGAEGGAPGAGGLTGGQPPTGSAADSPHLQAPDSGAGSGKGSSVRGSGGDPDAPGSGTGLSGLLGDGDALALSSRPNGRATATFDADAGDARAGWPLAVGTAGTALAATGFGLWRRRPLRDARLGTPSSRGSAMASLSTAGTRRCSTRSPSSASMLARTRRPARRWPRADRRRPDDLASGSVEHFEEMPLHLAYPPADGGELHRPV